MRSSISTSAASALTALVLLTAGCQATAPEPGSAREAAAAVLGEAIGDGTRVVGYSIGSDVMLLEGRDARQRRLYPVEQRPDEATPSTEGGPWVLGRDFDLAASLARAEAQLDRCPGWGEVDVRVLSPEALLTVTHCDEASYAMLNDLDLPPLGEPVDGGALATLIAELETSELEGSVTAIEYDRDQDAVTVSYLGDDPLREYHWIRGWSGATSLVTAGDIPAGTRLAIRPQALLGAPAELDLMVDGASGADVILIGPAAGGDAVEVQVS